MNRRWVRVVVKTGAVVLVLVAVAFVAFAQRPEVMPRYDAQDWAGTGVSYAGELDLAIRDGKHCWTLRVNGQPAGPATVALVFPDTYRTFSPALAELGMSGPSVYLSLDNVLAPAEIARPMYTVSLRGSDVTDAEALREATEQWQRWCGDSAVIIAVEPGSLAVA